MNLCFVVTSFVISCLNRSFGIKVIAINKRENFASALASIKIITREFRFALASVEKLEQENFALALALIKIKIRKISYR